MKAVEAFRFVAPDGSYWTVHEIRDAAAHGGSTSLIFVGDDGFRRIRDYPDNWRELEWDDLWALSWCK